MRSNFLALREHDESLFEVAYSAENLYINKQYHYIPTALRVFTEGVMQEILGIHQNDNVDLSVMIRNFRQEYHDKVLISGAADTLRKKGNNASHFQPNVLIDSEIKKLFQEAIRLQNFYLREYKKSNIPPAKFCLSSLPKPAIEIFDDIELEDLKKKLSQHQDKGNKIKEFKQQQAILNRKLSIYKHDFQKADSKLNKTNSEKNSLRLEIDKLKVDHDNNNKKLRENISKINKKNFDEKIELQNKTFQSELDKLTFHVKNLEMQKAKLITESETFKQKISENEDQQQKQIPIRTSLIEGLKSDIKDNIEVTAHKINELDAKQLELININTGLHFLAAPPGSGKTMILTSRLEKALNLYNDSNIICLTFTTRAAKVMNERAHSLLNGKNPFIGNFHNLCLELYRNSVDLTLKERFSSILPDLYRYEFFSLALSQARINNRTDYDIKMPQAFRDLVDEYAGEFGNGLVLQEKTRFDRYSYFKIYCFLLLLEISTDISLIQFAKKQLKPLLRKVIIACHKSYFGSDLAVDYLLGGSCLWQIHHKFRELKQNSNSIDYDDILCFGLLELTSNPLQKEFIQVDEVQDLNAIQWKIIESLLSKNTHLFVVGDAEQSIYSFLGADLTSLKSETHNFNQHSLIKNYRSNKEIVSLLNAYRKNTWGMAEIDSKNARVSANSTMLFKYDTQQCEYKGTYRAISTILKDKQRSIGLLLPTNKSVENLCNFFDHYKLAYFRVSASDLMQTPIIQDWFSLIRAHKGSANRIDWYNLVYRIAQCSHKSKNTTLQHAIKFVDALYENGISISDAISDQPYTQAHFNYRLKTLVNAWENDAVVIFDTETTGLNFDKAKIIQLAAIKVKAGVVVDIFDKYINIGLTDSSTELDIAFDESTKIHQITREQVAAGESELNVLSEFFDFVGEHPLIAHNMNFDNTMLRMGVTSLDHYELETRFNDITFHSQFDSLLLAKSLLPDEDSYKLESLLKSHKLEGVNSHNALDDVKATASLVQLLINKAKSKLANIDEILDTYNEFVRPLQSKLIEINNLIRSFYASGNIVKLSDILDEWVDYAYQQDDWYKKETEEATKKEVTKKLGNWLDDNDYNGHIHNLFNDLDPKSQQLFTLKEADLINPEKDKLVISTIHRAKGLEFETVIIPEVTSKQYPGWLPPETSEEDKLTHTEEKKRLLYVALSRPENKLIVSYHLCGTLGRYDYRTELYNEIDKCTDAFSWKNT